MKGQQAPGYAVAELLCAKRGDMFKDLTMESRSGLVAGFTPWLQGADIMKIVAANEQHSGGIMQINCATAQTGKRMLPNAVRVEQVIAMTDLQSGMHIASPPASGKHAIQTRASALPVTDLKPNANNGDEPQEFQDGCAMYPYSIFCFMQRTTPCS